jgi:hypothetical protein
MAASDPIAANADRILRVVIGGLGRLIAPPKTRPFADLPSDVLSAADWKLWQRAAIEFLRPGGKLSSPELAHLTYLFDDVTHAMTDGIYSGKITLFGVPAGGLERVELLPAVIFEHPRVRFDWPMNRILNHKGDRLFGGVVFAGKLEHVESLRDSLERKGPGRPPGSDLQDAAREARARHDKGLHGDARGSLRRACNHVAKERNLDADQVYNAATR